MRKMCMDYQSRRVYSTLVDFYIDKVGLPEEEQMKFSVLANCLSYSIILAGRRKCDVTTKQKKTRPGAKVIDCFVRDNHG